MSVCVICVDRFAVPYLLTFHSSLLYYNSICWCWTASRNVYFELTQEDFLSFSRTHLYICIFVYFCDTYLFLHWPLLFMWVFFIPVCHWFYSHHQGFSNWDNHWSCSYVSGKNKLSKELAFSILCGREGDLFQVI